MVLQRDALATDWHLVREPFSRPGTAQFEPVLVGWIYAAWRAGLHSTASDRLEPAGDLKETVVPRQIVNGLVISKNYQN
jgi:hypothetical protein